MLLNLEDLMHNYNMKVKGILHVGAHLAEEAHMYDGLGIKTVYWIEGNQDNIAAIERIVAPCGHWLISALVTDKDREYVQFNITNNDSMSSSVYEFGTHPQFSPETVFIERRMVESRTLDSLAEEYEHFPRVNFLNMDIQGAELLALRGATKLLEQIDYVYTEVNNAQVYVGCAQVEELDAILDEYERVETGWVPRQGWGDALYIRKDLR